MYDKKPYPVPRISMAELARADEEAKAEMDAADEADRIAAAMFAKRPAPKAKPAR